MITRRARRAASAFSRPITSAPETARRTSFAAASARPSFREPIAMGRPAFAKRSARPSPWSPVPPSIAIAFGSGSSMAAT
jgi:hypothetical protein